MAALLDIKIYLSFDRGLLFLYKFTFFVNLYLTKNVKFAIILKVLKGVQMTQENSVLLLRDKMKKADFRLVDLAEFLDISRPTAYKFIEFYELGQRQRLESKVLKLFEFIDKDEVPSKTELTEYIATHIIKANSSKKHELIASLLKNDNGSKIAFIELLTNSTLYDGLLPYLLACAQIANKAKISQKERTQVEPLLELYKALKLKFNIKDNK